MIKVKLCLCIIIFLSLFFVNGCDNTQIQVLKNSPSPSQSKGETELIVSSSPTPSAGVIEGESDQNENRYQVATEKVMIESERFVIAIEKGMVYPIEFEAYINEIFDLMEERTGLSFFPKGYENKKVTISVSEDNRAYAGENGIHVAQMDTFIYTGNCNFVYIHELSHVLQKRHCSICSQCFSEGYATYSTYLLEDSLSVADTIDTTNNYTHFQNERAMMENPEAFFFESSGWDSYLFGFRLAYYIGTEYDTGLYNSLIKTLQQKYGRKTVNNELLAEEIKAMTSENLFNDFSLWYMNHQDIFNRPYEYDDFRHIKEYHILPANFINNNIYNALGFIYDQTLLIDFTDGFWSLKNKGKTVKGIYGYFYSTGSHTISFYDNDDQWLESISINNGNHEFSVENAVKIKVQGDDTSVHFVYYYDQMVE